MEIIHTINKETHLKNMEIMTYVCYFLFIVSGLAKSKKNLLLLNTIGQFIYIILLFLNEKYLGTLTMSVSCLANILGIYLDLEKNYLLEKLYLFFFPFVFMLYTYNMTTPLEFLLIGASIISLIAKRQGYLNMRKLMFLSNFGHIIFGYHAGVEVSLYIGIIANIFHAIRIIQYTNNEEKTSS